MPAVIILIVLIAADQLLKWWTVSHLALGESAPLIPGVIQLTRLTPVPRGRAFRARPPCSRP